MSKDDAYMLKVDIEVLKSDGKAFNFFCKEAALKSSTCKKGEETS